MDKELRIKDIDENKLKEFVESGIDETIAKLFLSRGFTSSEHVKSEINFELKEIGSYKNIPNAEKSVDLIVNSIKNGDKIVVFGDYDCDGMTATTVLYKCLEICEANFDFFIPCRMEDGYGLTLGATKKVIEQLSPDLIITVDCGICSVEAVDYLNELGVKVVITDHHLPSEELPNTEYIVNPKLEDDCIDYMICGCAVSYKVAVGVLNKIGKYHFIDEYNYEVLPLVAIASVADMIPMFDESRIIVKHGMNIINECLYVKTGLNQGLKSLFLKTGTYFSEKISSIDFGFDIAPRINAVGRLSHGKHCVHLFISKDNKFTIDMADFLDDVNNIRKEMCKESREIAYKYIDEKVDVDSCKSLIVIGENFHKGTIGIVASNVLERYGKPTIVLAKTKKGYLVGSGRCVEGIHMKNMLDNCKDLLMGYGGHEGAVGLSLKQENLEEFKKHFEKYVSDRVLDGQKNCLDVDCVIDNTEISFDLHKKTTKLEPFGNCNKPPIFLSRNFRVKEFKLIGQDKSHLSLSVFDDKGRALRCVGFNMAEKFNSLKNNKSEFIDLAFEIGINNWNGSKYLQLMIKEIITK